MELHKLIPRRVNLKGVSESTPNSSPTEEAPSFLTKVSNKFQNGLAQWKEPPTKPSRSGLKLKLGGGLKKFQSFEEAAGALAERLLEAGPFRMTRIKNGAVNQVVRVDGPEGGIVVRLTTDPPRLREYEREAQAMALAQSQAPDLPIPAVLALGKLSVGGKTYAFMVQECMPGEVGNEAIDSGYQAGSSEASHQIWKQIGMVTRRFHSISTEASSRSALGTKRNSQHRRAKRAVRKLHQKGVLSRVQSLELLRMLSAVEGQQIQTLVHGNLVPKNVMVSSEGALSGILDFGNAALDSPNVDIAEVLAWWHTKEEVRAFFEGYGMTKEEFAQNREQIAAYVLTRLAKSAAHRLDEGKRPEKEIRGLHFLLDGRFPVTGNDDWMPS